MCTQSEVMETIIKDHILAHLQQHVLLDSSHYGYLQNLQAYC